jgi:hypothetical protein
MGLAEVEGFEGVGRGLTYLIWLGNASRSQKLDYVPSVPGFPGAARVCATNCRSPVAYGSLRAAIRRTERSRSHEFRKCWCRMISRAEPGGRSTTPSFLSRGTPHPQRKSQNQLHRFRLSSLCHPSLGSPTRRLRFPPISPPSADQPSGNLH